MSVEQLITQHIDTWTSALQTRSTAGRGNNGKIDLYGIKKLRELILELAVRGKLVPQDPNDEPASELLKRIAAEKAELVKQGKIKKQKPLPEIGEDEKPFELPVGWEWVRISEIGHDWGQKTPSCQFTYIDIGSIDKELGVINEPEIIQAKNAPSRARKIVKKGTVVYSTVRPYLLNIAVVAQEFSPEPVASTAFAIIHPFMGIFSDYIYYYLRSSTFITYVEGCQTGIAYPAINDKQFFTGLIAIPPSNEQDLIVNKVGELMALCDQLEQQSLTSLEVHSQLVETLLATLTDSKNAEELAENWARISQHFDTLFTTEASIDALKQTILQLAVMGKLVPQDPNDEPASELLKRIEQEKAQMVKEGKIKKQKPLPPISEDEKPFELPQGWEWCRIKEIAQVGTGSTPSRDNPDYWSKPEFNWVTSGETSSPFIITTAEKVSMRAVMETNISIYPPGTLVIAMYGQGKTRGQITELRISAGTNQACAAIQLFESNEFHRRYIKFFFEKSYEDLRSHAAGGAQPNLNLAKVSNTPIPIPPLAEQIKITSKVDELFVFCDNFKSRLQSAQQAQLHLADALTDAALS
ncbi:restriction endonuclease subunit S [Pantoea phytobeneficialis]|uniref:Restriction endonuclease n=1 Tax=Pantoea phytobeneficialis TaxID=2052056 RepID=A0AAP9H598_9GAMM|nr:restriction endonuclease subunit S [Pantoea phytobeneficialis]MDO6409815.1 restriction endonuclease subunit S [Pantoea phytobeneficialis]QGR07005.1 restriction endonuclease [Pantoea phytobeneficialis]